MGFALSFYYPVGNDAGKYLRVIKLVADGSVLKKDVSPGTVGTFFYLFTSFFYKFYSWNYETFRCILIFLNCLAIISFFFALKQLFNNFTAKLWVTLYALDPFIMSRILEINHYSVSNIFYYLDFQQ